MISSITFIVLFPLTKAAILKVQGEKDPYLNEILRVSSLLVSLSFIILSWWFIKVYHIILSLLATQRFLVFFFPKLEKIVNPGKKTMYLIIFLLYLTIVAQDVHYQSNRFTTPHVKFPRFYEILCFLLFITTFFHLPVYIRNRKNDNSLDKLQIIIFWQSIAICVAKILYILPIYLCNVSFTCNEQNYLQYLTLTDLITIPIIIQFTYIGCNIQHLEGLFTFIKRFFARGSSRQVHPYVVNNNQL
ncbi:hypothetical protein CRE_17859 [Caenorhabditis remanei]|uniref:Serpentine receptor class gamma n=1 Tax=Caenorhabditis remanei TaxID=31234 RepID=E3MDQ7_CAERE|nr:hypothetical protein CRE_17859 [Caenorhabditis remanei]